MLLTVDTFRKEGNRKLTLEGMVQMEKRAETVAVAVAVNVK